MNFSKSAAAGSAAGAVVDVVTGVGAGVQKVLSDDTADIVSGSMDILASLSVLIPPPFGKIAGATFGVVSFISSLFSKAPSDTEIMLFAIDAQTKQIEYKIDHQTEILVKYFEGLMTQGNKLAERTLREIQTTDFNQMIDDMYGIAASLKVKKEHLDRWCLK